jgi:hypothetical protein
MVRAELARNEFRPSCGRVVRVPPPVRLRATNQARGVAPSCSLRRASGRGSVTNRATHHCPRRQKTGFLSVFVSEFDFLCRSLQRYFALPPISLGSSSRRLTRGRQNALNEVVPGSRNIVGKPSRNSSAATAISMNGNRRVRSLPSGRSTARPQHHVGREFGSRHV